MSKLKVLVPLDRTDYSLNILPQIEKVIPPSDTTLILFHVAKPQTGIGTGIPVYEADNPMHNQPKIVGQLPHPIYADQLEYDIRSRVEQSLQLQGRPLTRKGYQVETQVYFGQPAAEILQVIEDEQVDLIAMTTHAREGVKRLFSGSVAEKVLHQVNIPILLLHPA